MIAGRTLPETPDLADRRLLTFEARAMGSPLRLSVVARTEQPGVLDVATRAWLAVRDEFEAVEQAMSRFRDASEVSRLNQLGGKGWTSLSPRLRQALTTSDRAHRLTRGTFDPRVLRDLERLGDLGAPVGGDGAPPGPATGIDERPAPARAVVEASGRRFRLPRPVDLGGIGKGLALRWAVGALTGLAVDGFLLEAGGDLVARGEPPEGGSWQIGLEDPTGGVEPLAVLALGDGAVTTSSVRRRHWPIGDREVHHLIDPRTGEPGGDGLLAVTVAAPDPAWSEIWSKTLFLAGRGSVADLARRRALAAWWIAADGSLEMTPAARIRTVWVAGEGG